MTWEISPEPDPAERAAILAALAAEEGEQSALSPWADALLPARDPPGEED
jgi:hypothetical protein